MDVEKHLLPKNELLKMVGRQYGIFNELNLMVEADNNFIYEFTQNRKEFILRGGTRHTEELIKAELDWIKFLDANGVKVSIPVPSKQGKFLEQINYNGTLYNVVVFEKAQGRKVDLKNPKVWNEQFWEIMGRVMGKLHYVSTQYNKIKPQFRRPMYNEDEYINILANLNSKQDKIIFEKVKCLINLFDQLPKDSDAFGVIHYDLHTDNFHKNGNDIIIFDWDDSHYFFFMYDLAATFHETIWDNPHDKRQEFANLFIPSFWKGYSSVYPLNRKWLPLLPKFFKWREFQIYTYLRKEFSNGFVSEQFKSVFKNCLIEFQDWLLNDTQIVNIPTDLRILFPL